MCVPCAKYERRYGCVGPCDRPKFKFEGKQYDYCHRFDLGTFLHGRGMYEGKEKEIIFTIAERKDLPRLKDEVKEIDPNAFISTMHASKDSPRPGM